MKVEDFRDLHKGERIFVVGAGPSLNNTNLELLRDEITIGCNAVYLLADKINLNYLCTPIYVSRLSAITAMHPELKIFFWPSFLHIHKKLEVCEMPNVATCIRFLEESEHKHKEDFMKVCAEGYVDNCPFFDGFNWDTTCGVVALRLSAFMGAKEIYLVGCDSEVKPSGLCHFDAEYDKMWVKKSEDGTNPHHESRSSRIAGSMINECNRLGNNMGIPVTDCTVDGALRTRHGMGSKWPRKSSLEEVIIK